VGFSIPVELVPMRLSKKDLDKIVDVYKKVDHSVGRLNHHVATLGVTLVHGEQAQPRALKRE
jgi:hypothetical protein